MPLAQSVQWTDPQHITVTSQIETTNRELRAATESLEHTREVFAKIQHISDTLSPQIRALYPAEHHASNYVLDSLLSTLQTGISGQQERLNSHTQTLDRYRATLANLGLRKARMRGNGENNLTRQQLIDQIGGLDNVQPGTIVLGTTRSSSQPYIGWTMQGIALSPSECPRWFPADAPLPTLSLPPVRVRVDLLNNDVMLAPLREHRGDPAHLPFIWSGCRTPHPHVLTSYVPCLGDFAPAIADSISAGDYASLVGVLRMFLQTATIDDPAGRQFVDVYADTLGLCPHSIGFIRSRIQTDGPPKELISFMPARRLRGNVATNPIYGYIEYHEEQLVLRQTTPRPVIIDNLTLTECHDVIRTTPLPLTTQSIELLYSAPD